MDFGISGALYPRTRSYLKSLPDGFASYAECLMTADFLQVLWPDVASIVEEASFPEALRVRLSTPLQSGAWIPTTSMVLCAELLRDRILRDDKQYATYMFDRGCQLYERPIYKAMMFVLSPNLVVMGASKRWQSFYRGTHLQVTSMKKNEATAELTFPVALFSFDYLVALGNLFCAAAFCAGAQSPAYTLSNALPRSAEYSLRWL